MPYYGKKVFPGYWRRYDGRYYEVILVAENHNGIGKTVIFRSIDEKSEVFQSAPYEWWYSKIKWDGDWVVRHKHDGRWVHP